MLYSQNLFILYNWNVVLFDQHLLIFPSSLPLETSIILCVSVRLTNKYYSKWKIDRDIFCRIWNERGILTIVINNKHRIRIYSQLNYFLKRYNSFKDWEEKINAIICRWYDYLYRKLSWIKRTFWNWENFANIGLWEQLMNPSVFFYTINS